MDRKLTEFSGKLKDALGADLVSFIVYGSAVTGEFYNHSDFNTIIVLKESGPGQLKAMAGPVKKWVSGGQPVPMIFTRAEISDSDDVFPMEYLDIKENSTVLYGEDVFKKIKPSGRNLRLEIERELRSKLIRLKQNYILTGGRPSDVRNLMIRSVSSFIAILKGILRLNDIKAPAKKKDAVEAAPAELKLNKQLFFDILSMKEGSKEIADGSVDAIFSDYMKELDLGHGLCLFLGLKIHFLDLKTEHTGDDICREPADSHVI